MKFRDGMWLPAEGKRPEYAEEIYSIEPREDGKALSLLCPTKRILERPDSLNCGTLTIVSINLVFERFHTDFPRILVPHSMELSS